MRKLILLGLTGLLLISLSACALFDEFNSVEESPSHDLNTYTEQELIDLIETLLPEAYQRVDYDLDAFEEALTDMVESKSDSVVGIRVFEETFGTGGTGSGVIYKKDSGTYYVVTNEHVIENYQRVEIVYERNGMLFTIDSNVEVLGADPNTDLAVLTFESTRNFNTVEFADSYDLSVGQFVFAIGNPLGFDYYGTLTMGVVSGLARYVNSSDLEVPFIQHDASLSPGNSGGALFDINGNLVGINNMKIADQLASNINFAIPANTVSRIIYDLEHNGRVIRPYLGVSAIAQVSDCGQDYGVCITVQDGGAAADANLENGDIIIGYKLESWDDYIEIMNFNDLREAILNSQVGDSVSLRIMRDETIIESPYVSLNSHPDDE